MSSQIDDDDDDPIPYLKIFETVKRLLKTNSELRSHVERQGSDPSIFPPKIRNILFNDVQQRRYLQPKCIIKCIDLLLDLNIIELVLPGIRDTEQKENILEIICCKGENLKNLDMSRFECVQKDMAHLKTIISSFDHLRYLLFSCSTEYFFQNILTELKNLPVGKRPIVLNIPKNIHPKLAAVILLELPTLKSIGDYSLESALREIPLFRSPTLELTQLRSSYLKIDDLAIIKKYCPKINDIRIIGPFKKTVQNLGKFKKLQKISLRVFNMNEFDRYLNKKPRKRLTNIELIKSKGIIYLNRILKSCPRLKKLKIKDVICKMTSQKVIKKKRSKQSKKRHKS